MRPLDGVHRQPPTLAPDACALSRTGRVGRRDVRGAATEDVGRATAARSSPRGSSGPASRCRVTLPDARVSAPLAVAARVAWASDSAPSATRHRLRRRAGRRQCTVRERPAARLPDAHACAAHPGPDPARRGRVPRGASATGGRLHARRGGPAARGRERRPHRRAARPLPRPLAPDADRAVLPPHAAAPHLVAGRGRPARELADDPRRPRGRARGGRPRGRPRRDAPARLEPRRPRTPGAAARRAARAGAPRSPAALPAAPATAWRRGAACLDRALAEAGCGHTAAAVALLRRALALAPGDPEIAHALGNVAFTGRRPAR